MANEKRYGMRKEDQLAHYLHRRGADVELSAGSEGPADLVASWTTGTIWAVQVKASRSGEPAMPTSRDLGRLKQSAARRGATPVVAKISGNQVEFVSARTGRALKPPRSR